MAGFGKFKFNREELIQDRVYNDYLSKTGVYKATIKEAEFKGFGDLESEALVMTLDVQVGINDETKEPIIETVPGAKLFYQGATGKAVKFQVDKIMGLAGLLNLQDADPTYLDNALVGKEIKVAIAVRQQDGTDYLNRELDAFFDPETNKSFKERELNRDAEDIVYWAERYTENEDGDYLFAKPEAQGTPAPKQPSAPAPSNEDDDIDPDLGF